LNAKADGRKLIGARMTIPRFALWEDFPDFERL
jgi:hypothetical protein